jgi:hypothetical protein
VDEAIPMTNLRMENLNVKKFVLLLTLPLTIVYFILLQNRMSKNDFNLVLSLLSSPLMGVITAWLLAFVLGIIYEALKLCRPLLNWLFK